MQIYSRMTEKKKKQKKKNKVLLWSSECQELNVMQKTITSSYWDKSWFNKLLR